MFEQELTCLDMSLNAKKNSMYIYVLEPDLRLNAVILSLAKGK